MKRFPYSSGLELSENHGDLVIEWNPRRQLFFLVPTYILVLIITILGLDTNNMPSDYRAFVIFVIVVVFLGFFIWIAYILLQKRRRIISLHGDKISCDYGHISVDEIESLIIQKEVYEGSTRNNYYILLKNNKRVELVSVESLQFGNDIFASFAKKANIDIATESIRTSNLN